MPIIERAMILISGAATYNGLTRAVEVATHARRTMWKIILMRFTLVFLWVQSIRSITDE